MESDGWNNTSGMKITKKLEGMSMEREKKEKKQGEKLKK